MAVTNTYGSISEGVAGYSARELLNRGLPHMVARRFATTTNLPKNRGQVIKFRRYLNLAAALSPIQEGITPDGQEIQFEDVYATLQQYGDLTTLTDVIADTHEDPVLDEYLDILAEQVKETFERLLLNLLKGGTTVFYAGTGTTRATVNGVIDRGDVRKVTRFLKKNRASMVTKINGATTKIATEPVRAGFFAIHHTDMEPDIRDMQDFIDSENYANSNTALETECGACHGVRFLSSELFDPFLAAATSATGTTFLSNGATVTAAAAPDVYPVIIFGKNAFGSVKLAGESTPNITPRVFNPGEATKEDPNGQRGVISWIGWDANAILNNTWMARVESACTAEPS